MTSDFYKDYNFVYTAAGQVWNVTVTNVEHYDAHKRYIFSFETE